LTNLAEVFIILVAMFMRLWKQQKAVDMINATKRHMQLNTLYTIWAFKLNIRVWGAKFNDVTYNIYVIKSKTASAINISA